MNEGIRNNDIKKVPQVILGVMFAVGLCGFAVLTYNVVPNGSLPFDDPVRFSIYDLRSSGLTTLMELITEAGYWPAIVVICLLLLIYPKTRSLYGIPVSMAAILTQILEKTTKYIVCRPRPDVSYQLVRESSYSFPSGHSVTSMAVYLLLFILICIYMNSGAKKTVLMILTLFLSIAIGISRIYLGVHYPSDVLAGWCGGWMMTAAVLLIRDNTKIGHRYMMPS